MPMGVAALCTAALVLLARTALGQEELFEDQTVVPIAVGEYGPRGMPGDTIELRDGTLLLSYTRAGHWAKEEAPEGIYARRSADAGRTWGEESLLLANPGPPSTRGRYCHPSFLRLPNGDILFAYIYSADVEPYYGHNYYKRSSDDGVTWSEQFVLTPRAGYVLMHNDKLRLLSTGRIVAPVEYKKHRPSAADHSDYASMCFYSDDNGYSWHASANDIDVLPHESQEPHIVELEDGRLMLLFRTYSGFVGRAYSEDGGESWLTGELVDVLPMSKRAGAVTVDRIPTTGDLLLIRCLGTDESGRRRTPLISEISRDDGNTWECRRVIAGDPEGDYGYQSVTFVDDAAVISYHARDGLHVARISAEWFYASDE